MQALEAVETEVSAVNSIMASSSASKLRRLWLLLLIPLTVIIIVIILGTATDAPAFAFGPGVCIASVMFTVLACTCVHNSAYNRMLTEGVTPYIAQANERLARFNVRMGYCPKQYRYNNLGQVVIVSAYLAIWRVDPATNNVIPEMQVPMMPTMPVMPMVPMMSTGVPVNVAAAQSALMMQMATAAMMQSGAAVMQPGAPMMQPGAPMMQTGYSTTPGTIMMQPAPAGEPQPPSTGYGATAPTACDQVSCDNPIANYSSGQSSMTSAPGLPPLPTTAPSTFNSYPGASAL
ncbi:MAG: hypothetical protein EOO65_02265 [Methanosarcinales archaeon]|nr:MAG: hypothetical protein EOO65_02265 [Methanosarcinales archaeon]